VEMVVFELLQVREPNFYCNGIFQVVPEWDKYIDMYGNYIEKVMIVYISFISLGKKNMIIRYHF
jgi:hypothetical protein